MTGHATRRAGISFATALASIGGVVIVLSVGARSLGAQISPGPLARAHAELEGAANCVKCHGVRREPMSALCLSCHKEILALQRERRGYHGRVASSSGKTCAQCHPDHAGDDFRMIEWPGGHPSRFDHTEAGWALEGKHRDAKCETCHARKFRTAQVAALSPRTVSAGWVGLGQQCVGCHKTDDAHRGELDAKCERCHDARAWAPAPAFDHQASRYTLTGAHEHVKCSACHVTPKLPVRVNGDGERIGSFKPVPFAECSSCHADPHKGALGARCHDCHSTRGFDVIDKSGFNHQVTRYPLRGKHTSVSCEGCHGAALANRKPAFATCAGCHANVHGSDATLGGATTDCASCHGVQGFVPSTFSVRDHSASKYPLEGRHVTVRCGACHLPTPAARVAGVPAKVPARIARIHVPSATCAACHADAHDGDLAANVQRGVCESCHTTTGFAPSAFARSQHATLRVSLAGRHGDVACAACHGPSRAGLPPLPVAATRKARVTLSLADASCASCHVDPHNGRYDAKGAVPQQRGCVACHSELRWRPATTTSSLHGTFSYRLEGAHRAVSCVACHTDFSTAPASATLRLAARGVASLPFTTSRSTSCVTCHETPHGTQFAARTRGAACESCHDLDAFAPASAFDHERDATFSLKGAHARVPCASCHRSPAPGRPVVYRPLATTCESCHAGKRVTP
jgi:hypothetical protein